MLPPSIMREYEQLVPGSAGRILDHFFAEGSHRRRVENRGAWFAFIQYMALLGVVAALGFLRIGGLATILAGIAAVLGNSAILAFVFAKGRYPRQPRTKP